MSGIKAGLAPTVGQAVFALRRLGARTAIRTPIPSTPREIVYAWEEVQKIQASDGTAKDQFGLSVAISGSTLIVGARRQDSGGSDAGAAYIFEKSGSTWVQTQIIQASDAQKNDKFGQDVAISGTIAIVGAPEEDAGGSNAGAAYIFEKIGSTWTEKTKLTASDAQASDQFGYVVAISGTRVIVGAPKEDTPSSNAGAAYIFEKSGLTWSQIVKLQGNDTTGNDWFGINVAISGTTAIVGARYQDSGANNAGAAYIFEESGGTWSQTQKIQSSPPVVNAQFGIAVAINGTKAIVGAYRENGSRGAAYVFEKNGTWSQTAKLTASDAQGGDYFGFSVALSGTTIVVSAYLEDTGGNRAGAGYFFRKSGSAWPETQKVMASDPDPGDHFAFSVATLDGTTAVFGAQGPPPGPLIPGVAYIFERKAT